MIDFFLGIWNTLFVIPITNLLLAIYKLLEMVHFPYTLGFSIIFLTILIRIVLTPFTKKQLETTRKMQELSPKISALKEKHKDNPQKIQAETMALYKEHGINPFGSCLPTIVQIIMFPALYSVFLTFVGKNAEETINKFNEVAYFPALELTTLSNPTFFGLPLAESPSSLMSVMPVVAILVPVVTALLQLIQTKMMFPSQKDKPKKNAKSDPDFQSVMQKQMVFLIPITIGIAAWTFPLGLALYWNTFTIFGIIQQYRLQGWGGLAEWKDKLPQKKSSK